MVRSRTEIEKQSEYRLTTRTFSEQDESEKRHVLKVVKGSCEIFGEELFVGYEYYLQPQSSYGIFSWFGCTVEVDNSILDSDYVSSDTTMVEVLQVHQNLEIRRENSAKPPKVAIIGPSNSGKSTVARILGTYANRMNRKPLMVNIDITKNDIGIPGTIGASVLEDFLQLHGADGEIGLHSFAQLLYFVGNEKITENPQRLQEQIEILEKQLSEKSKADPLVESAGWIIDTFAWSKKSRTEKPLLAALKSLGVNIVLVMGNDMLLSVAKKALPDTTVVKIPISGGVAEQDDNTRKKLASRRIQNYFYGASAQLLPFRKTVKLEDIKIYLIGAKVVEDSSIRPIGMDLSTDETQVAKLKVVDPSLESSLLAMVYPTTDEKDILNSNVAGFAHVAEIDSANQEITFILPCPTNELPTTCFVKGNIKWYES